MEKEKKIIIDQINSDKLKSMNQDELIQLAKILRERVIETVSKNGGHLSSNLGIVELTIALHRVFDFNIDVIVWDVGHQSYIHKILTGRNNQFDSLRKWEGLSGFPKREESPYDFFNTGHSSTAISAAYGYAKAKTLKKEEGMVIAVVGDGAMTGGMAFEALNDAGSHLDNLLVILNDNEMSISRNVGSVPKYLAKIREKSIYNKANEQVRNMMDRIPLVGKSLKKAIHRMKGAIKYYFTNEALFEEFGFRFYGPVDGHNIKDLEKTLKSLKAIKGPKLLHVLTQKGKGYKKAENQPHYYHGVGKFDIINGIDPNGKGKSFSEITGELLSDIATVDRNVVVICPAMSIGSGLTSFAKEHPDRFFDVGIAEQHGVTFAAGLACSGFKPVVVMYSSFMQRAYDQILHDVCLMDLNVLFCVDRAGIIPHDGETHQGIYDLAFLSHMPNITLFAPSNKNDYQWIMQEALEKIKGPVVIRYPKSSCLHEDNQYIDPYQARVIKRGNNICILAYGRILQECKKAVDELEKKNISCSLVDIKCLKPLDFKTILTELENTKKGICFEDVVFESSCSQMILSHLKSKNIDIDFHGHTLQSAIVEQGDIKQLLKHHCLDSDGIQRRIEGIVNEA